MNLKAARSGLDGQKIDSGAYWIKTLGFMGLQNKRSWPWARELHPQSDANTYGLPVLVQLEVAELEISTRGPGVEVQRSGQVLTRPLCRFLHPSAISTQHISTFTRYTLGTKLRVNSVSFILTFEC